MTRLDSVSLGIVVNKQADRFYDEGEDFWPKRYAIWGALIAGQPDQMAFSIVDSKAIGSFMPSVYPPVVATVGTGTGGGAGSSRRTGSRPPSTRSIVRSRMGTYDQAALDDCRTEGLIPNKTHWARPIDTPPYWGYPLRPGITFTYLGLKVDDQRARGHEGRRARRRTSSRQAKSWPATCSAQGYVAGVGMTIGTVFGQIAGTEAARHAIR